MPPNTTPSRIDALENLRGCAASYVFAHHIVHYYLNIPLLRKVFVFGQLSVMLFFIMSGFVIYYSSFGRKAHPSFGNYLVRRFRRIYPLFLIALGITYLCRAFVLGRPFMPDPLNLAGNVAMLQDHDRPGNWFTPFLNNDPLWSLSYEWTFYLLFFPTIWLLRDRIGLQKYGVLALSLFGFVSHRLMPNPISMFLTYYVIWWSGVELAREYLATGGVTFRAQAGSILGVAVIGSLFLATLLTEPRIPLERNAPGVLEFRHFASVFAAIVVGISWYRLGGRGFNLLFGWGRHLAALSYAIYVFHVPVLRIFTDRLPWLSPFLAVPSMIGIVLVLSYLTEQKLQPIINVWIDPRKFSGLVSPKKAVVGES